jgi:translation initiation factor 2-alpha kinase 4
MTKQSARHAEDGKLDTDRIQHEELEAMRAIFGDDWHDISPSKTAWGTSVETGWWIVRLRAHDGRIAISLKGKLLKVGHSPRCIPLLRAR